MTVTLSSHRLPVHGFGLWSVNRGIVRRNAAYKSALARADAPRRNDLDGRGNLSNEGLIHFLPFLLGGMSRPGGGDCYDWKNWSNASGDMLNSVAQA